MANQRILFHHLSIPLKHRFDTAQAEVTMRDIGVVECGSSDSIGWGEASPFPGQDNSVVQFLADGRSGAVPATLLSGVEAALADLSNRHLGRSLAATVGSSRERVPVSIAVGIAADALEIVRQAANLGVNRFKLKIAPGHLTHIRLIRSENPNCILGVDANGSFDASSIEQMAALADLGLAYVEQPCDTTDEATLTRLKDLIDVPVFADESVRSLADVQTALASPFIDGVVVKPARLGMVESVEAVNHTDSSGKRWRASGLVESGIGRAYTDMLAALPSAFVSDVAPADWFLEHDLVPSRFEDGQIVIPRGPGIGIEPDREVMNRYLVRTYDISELASKSGVLDRGR